MTAFSPAPGPGDSQPWKIAQEQCRSVAVLMQNSRTGLHAQRVLSDTAFEGGGSVVGRRHRLVSTRKAAGFSQERLAEAVGVERSTVSSNGGSPRRTSHG